MLSFCFIHFLHCPVPPSDRIPYLVEFVYYLVKFIYFHKKRPKPAQWQAPAFLNYAVVKDVLFRLFAQSPECCDRKVNSKDNKHDSDAGLDVAPGIASLELRKDRLDQ